MDQNIGSGEAGNVILSGGNTNSGSSPGVVHYLEDQIHKVMQKILITLV